MTKPYVHLVACWYCDDLGYQSIEYVPIRFDSATRIEGNKPPPRSINKSLYVQARPCSCDAAPATQRSDFAFTPPDYAKGADKIWRRVRQRADDGENE